MKYKYSELVVIPKKVLDKIKIDTIKDALNYENLILNSTELQHLMEYAFDKGELSCEKSIEWDMKAISLSKLIKLREEFFKVGIEL